MLAVACDGPYVGSHKKAGARADPARKLGRMGW